MTEADVRLARRISELAAAAGAEVECASLAHLELALDSPGGQLISGDAERSCILADPQGDKVCLTSWRGRT